MSQGPTAFLNPDVYLYIRTGDPEPIQVPRSMEEAYADFKREWDAWHDQRRQELMVKMTPPETAPSFTLADVERAAMEYLK